VDAARGATAQKDGVVSFTHRFVSPLLDDGSATAVGPSRWNDVLVLDEGAHNHPLKRDEADLDDGLTVGVLQIAGGGTGATDAATARANLDIYSRGDIDARAVAMPLPIAQGGTGATSTAQVRTNLNVFSKEEMRTVALTGLQLGWDDYLWGGCRLIKGDPSQVVHLGGPGATGLVMDAAFNIGVNQWLRWGEVQGISCDASGQIFLGGGGATSLNFGGDLYLAPGQWIRMVDGTDLIGFGSDPNTTQIWLAPYTHSTTCVDRNGQVSHYGNLVSDMTVSAAVWQPIIFGRSAVEASLAERGHLPGLVPDADGKMSIGHWLGSVEALLTLAWQELIQDEAVLTARERRDAATS
jgi:hypothetical protein